MVDKVPLGKDFVRELKLLPRHCYSTNAPFSFIHVTDAIDLHS
jgi:hypothetical protein